MPVKEKIWDKLYWNALIILQKPEHREKLKDVAKASGLSRAKFIGKLIAEAIEVDVI